MRISRSFQIFSLQYFILYSVCSKRILLDTTTSVNPLENLFLQFPLEEEYLNYELIITAQFDKLVLPSIGMLASTPTSTLPTGKTFIKNDFYQYESDSVFFDREGYETLSSFQFIRVTSISTQDIGDWTVGLYNTIDSAKVVRLKVIVVKQKEGYCEGICSQEFGASQCAQTGQKDVCICRSNYVGKRCSIELEKNNSPNLAIEFEAAPFVWKVISFGINNFQKEDNYSIELSGEIIQDVIMVFLFDGSSIPSFLQNSQVVSQNSDPVVYPLSKDGINEAFLKSQQVQVAFFNMNQNTLKVQCNLEIVSFIDANQQKDITVRDQIIIVGLILLFFFVICVGPITVIAMRKIKLLRLRKEAAINIKRQQAIQQEEFLRQIRISTIFSRNPASPSNNQQIAINISPRESIYSLKKNANKDMISLEIINEFMPIYQFKTIKKLFPSLIQEEIECIVCLENFEVDKNCRITPCLHIFHSGCLEKWFEKHDSCPYCRSGCSREVIISNQSKRSSINTPQMKTAPNFEYGEQEQDQKQQQNVNQIQRVIKIPSRFGSENIIEEPSDLQYCQSIRFEKLDYFGQLSPSNKSKDLVLIDNRVVDRSNLTIDRNYKSPRNQVSFTFQDYCEASIIQIPQNSTRRFQFPLDADIASKSRQEQVQIGPKVIKQSHEQKHPLDQKSIQSQDNLERLDQIQLEVLSPENRSSIFLR